MHIHVRGINHCLFVSSFPSNMLVYLRDGSAVENLMFCHNEIEVADYISPSHSMPTAGQPVPVLILYRQEQGRKVTVVGLPIFKSPAWLHAEKVK